MSTPAVSGSNSIVPNEAFDRVEPRTILKDESKFENLDIKIPISIQCVTNPKIGSIAIGGQPVLNNPNKGEQFCVNVRVISAANTGINLPLLSNEEKWVEGENINLNIPSEGFVPLCIALYHKPFNTPKDSGFHPMILKGYSNFPVQSSKTSKFTLSIKTQENESHLVTISRNTDQP